jgi:hypothetical protein
LIRGDIYTHGGYIYTDGGGIYTHGGYIDTHGGGIYTDGGNINTHGGNIYTHGGGIYTHGGNINTHGGDIDTHGGGIDCCTLNCGILYWCLMCMPVTKKIVAEKIRPDECCREYWQERLGIELTGCWDEIEKTLAPYLEKIPEILKDPKWTPTERWIIESWLPKECKSARIS